MDTWKLKTINDALKYCQETVRFYNIEMTVKEKEALASEILGFSAGDYFSEWRKDYPVVNDIQALAADLSWSNAIDVDEDWEKLIKCIDDLAQQVGGKE